MHDKLRLSRLSLAYWNSGEALQAWLLASLLAACTIAIVWLNMLLNNWQVGFYNQLQHYDSRGFFDCLRQFITLAGFYVFASGYQAYFRMALEIRWRRWLTDRYIILWLHDQAYYRLNLTNPSVNPDQRISEDIRLFIANTLDLSLGLLRHIVMLLVFSLVLWRLSGIATVSLSGLVLAVPGYLFWLALLYSALGTWFIIHFGRPLIARNILQQSNEADFRSCLTRIKDDDECIALQGGEKSERLNLAVFFQRITENYRCIARHTRTITFISAAYSQLSLVFAFLIAAPRYFNHELQLGQLFEISGAYWYVHSALSYIIDSFSKVALWKAVASRLDSFSRQMADAAGRGNSRKAITFTRSHQLKLKNLTVLSPAGHILLNNLSLELNARDRLLISGPTGCGKTVLLRTIAGIWPYFTGAISKPADGRIVFLPQKPYVPSGPLREALLYPGGQSLPDKRLAETLKRCNLPGLAGKLEQSGDWEKCLSLGERQCLAFARAILQRPGWLFLDEATSSVDRQTEHSLYRLLEETVPAPAIVSVGHRETLRPFHTLQLNLEDSGDWDMVPLGNDGFHSASKRLSLL